MICGVTAGLAVLTKAPSLVLGILVLLVVLSAPLANRGAWTLPRLVGSLVVAGLPGCGGRRRVVADVLGRAHRIRDSRCAVHAGHERGAPPRATTSWGRPSPTPVPGDHPLAILFRLSPLALAGLVSLGVLLPPPSLRKPTCLLVLFTVGFILFLSLAGRSWTATPCRVFPPST